MKYRLAIIIFAGVMLFQQTLHSQSTEIKYRINDDKSKLFLSGTSTLSRFRFISKAVLGTGTVQKYGSAINVDPKASAVGKATRVQVALPTESLDSGNRKMNQDMRAALKADEFNMITYDLLQAKLSKKTNEWFEVETLGRLEIAGQVDSVTMTVKLRQLKNGMLQVVGQKTLRMSDFGITPPAVLNGLIKVKDRIVISFDLVALMEKPKISGYDGIQPSHTE